MADWCKGIVFCARGLNSGGALCMLNQGLYIGFLIFSVSHVWNMYIVRAANAHDIGNILIAVITQPPQLICNEMRNPIYKPWLISAFPIDADQSQK